jgi:hypothetical protein
MDMVESRQRIASAFLTNDGPHGSISQRARQRRVSRQRIYREAAWVVKQLQTPDWQRERQALQEQVRALTQRVAVLEKQQRWALILDPDKQSEFASVGQAGGVSLPEVRLLLQVLLREQAPSVAKLGRWTKAAGAKAGELLKVIDEFARPLVAIGAADEIYTKAPVLMVVEPASLYWAVGQRSATVTGEAWQATFACLPNLEQVLRDEGSGLTRGVKLANEARAKQNGKPLVASQDHFHSFWEGGKGLSRAERAAKAAFAQADKVQKEYDERRRQGHSLAGITTRVSSLWRKAEQAMDRWREQERWWKQAKDALLLVTPVGELNTPERAEQLVKEALASLPDAEFGKSKRQLQQPETFTYLAEVQRKLAALPAPPEVKAAAVQQECLRCRPELLQGESPQAAAMRGVLLLCAVVLAKSGEVGKETAQAVHSIFRKAWRASSLVECLNSVLRMQQARHRNLSQGLLDLKRLYWNSHAFRTGRRRGKSPYEHLGVELPAGVRWWELLKWPPEQLREKLSAAKTAI